MVNPADGLPVGLPVRLVGLRVGPVEGVAVKVVDPNV